MRARKKSIVIFKDILDRLAQAVQNPYLWGLSESTVYNL